MISEGKYSKQHLLPTPKIKTEDLNLLIFNFLSKAKMVALLFSSPFPHICFESLQDSTYGLPELRSGHVMASTNQGLVIFGGISSRYPISSLAL